MFFVIVSNSYISYGALPLLGTFPYHSPLDVVKIAVVIADVNRAVNSFWSGFSKVLSERDIDDEHVRCYLEWARQFAMRQKGALRARSLDDIPACIADLAVQPALRTGGFWGKG